jgi:pilus assembly protein CpaE
MAALVVCDAAAVAAQMRALLVRYGRDCPLSHVVSHDLAGEVTARLTPPPDLIVLVENADRPGVLATLARLRAATTGSIAVLGPADDPQHILRALHAGANDYVDPQGDLEAEMEALLRRLAAPDRPGVPAAQVIAVTSANGGSGRSLLACNLAVALARAHQRCGLIDLNLCGGDLSALLNLRPRYTVVDLCRNAGNLDQGMLTQALTRHECGVELLAAPSSHTDLDEVHSQAIHQVVQLARAAFPQVVVDVEDHYHKEQVRVLKSSDVTLVVLRPDFVSVRNTRQALEEMERSGIERARLRLVLNRTGHPKEMSATDVQSALEMPVSHVIPDDPRTVLPSVNFGAPVMLEAPASAFAKALEAIAESISPRPTVAGAGGSPVAEQRGLLARVKSVMGVPNWDTAAM